MEDRFPIVDILAQTPAIPENCQWALFLRNHDELTLEMVTDEERDYMYRVYAHDPQARINLGIRRRLAPLLGNDRRRIELMNGLLFSLPGTPVIYYGDEIGMGDNIYLGDRNGVRTPMQWSADRNAGFSRANPQQLYLPVDHRPRVPLRGGQRRGAAEQPALAALVDEAAASRCASGTRRSAGARSSSCTRRTARCWPSSGATRSETILVVANLSRVRPVRRARPVATSGAMVPVELFGRTEFPPIGELPYLLTLGPARLLLVRARAQRARTAEAAGDETGCPVLERERRLGRRPRAGRPATARSRACLPATCRARRWFGGKARAHQAASRSSRRRAAAGARAAGRPRR